MASERNPYAAPSRSDVDVPDGPDGDDDRAYRDGELLMLPRFGGRLPRRCCVCNARAREHVHRAKLYWHPQWVLALVLISPLLYVIVSFVVRKNATVDVYLCGDHKRRRGNGIALMIGGTLGALLIGVAGQSGSAIGLGLLVFLGSLIGGAVMMRTVVAAKMDERYVWLKVAKPFLESIRRSV